MDKKEQIIYKAISVEDRMPKIANENYLTISKNGFEKPRFYNGTRFETAHYEGDITHWLERETLSQPKEDKDLLDKMYNYLKNLQTPNVSLEQKPVESEWISVEDRLPEYGSYLCCDMDNWVEVCYIRFDRTDWHSENTDRVRTPTHWMPLPKPLKK